ILDTSKLCCFGSPWLVYFSKLGLKVRSIEHNRKNRAGEIEQNFFPLTIDGINNNVLRSWVQIIPSGPSLFIVV
ncbi:MAG: hypothetical protein M3115_04810, partial [Thermoproteota archaeon]|nr:hypothetical protein [Thermoproteota archaeon]